MTLLRCPDSGLVFDESRHVYTYQGQTVPSVTQILARLSDLSMIDQGVLERARKRGTLVHTMLDWYENDDLDESTLTDQLAGYLLQYKKFKHATGFVPLIVEGRLYSAVHRYAGTFDLFGHIKSAPTLLDTKSGMVPKTAGLQTAAYKALGVEAGVMPRTTRRRCLDLKQNTWQLTDEYRGEHDLETFIAALTIHKWANPEGLHA